MAFMEDWGPVWFPGTVLSTRFRGYFVIVHRHRVRIAAQRQAAATMAGMETGQSFRVPRPLRVLAGKALERALNRALRLDPAAAARLGGLDGQSVELHLDGPELALRVWVDGDALRVGPPAEAASLRVRTTPGAVLAMALDARHEVPPGKLQISGDAGLARQMEGLLKNWQPDLEAALSGIFGDVAGVPIARAVSGTARSARRRAADLREDGAASLRDEARLTPSRAEVDDWLDGVDQVSELSERLEQRLTRLEPDE